MYMYMLSTQHFIVKNGDNGFYMAGDSIFNVQSDKNDVEISFDQGLWQYVKVKSQDFQKQR